MIQTARLFSRDGLPGVFRLWKMRLRGEKLMVPAWWISDNLDDQDFLLRWDTFVAKTPPECAGVVLIYSAMPFRASEGQRATWLARSFVQKGFRVVFAYWRWSLDDSIEQDSDWPDVLSLPLDVLWRQGNLILSSSPIQPLKRLCLLEFPHPSLFSLVNIANAYGWKTIYDLIDDWTEFHRAGQAAWYDADFERYLSANVQVLTATNPVLVSHLEEITETSVHLLPNAYDPDSLTMIGEPAALRKGTVTLGYFGHLTSAWFDWDLIVAVARRNPSWMFHLLGYGADGHPDLPANVILPGKIPHDQLANYAKNWDLAIIPFKKTSLVRAVDPIKIYEYLGLHLRVITQGLPHLQGVPYVFNVQSVEDFERTVKLALNAQDDLLAVEAFLARNTWRNRADWLISSSGNGSSSFFDLVHPEAVNE
ncbi:MAG TPA: hypothetical protein VHO48_14860 [Anaerolineaceae bacterium]|nr:hypothetical protein [Anaerolineaceae bacterium]